MEVKKNSPSLPSNYVTLAHLQQRWLEEQENKKNKEKQLEEQQKQQQQQMLQRHDLQEHDSQRGGDEEVKVVVQRRGTDSRSAPPNNRDKQFRRKFRSGSRSDPPAIKLKAEDHPKLEIRAGIGGENAVLESKGNESTKKNKKKRTLRRKPAVDKEGRGTTMEGNKEAENSETKSGDDRKTTIKVESNDKSSKSSTTEVEVEQKFAALSMNPGNGGLRKVPDGFRNSQSQRRNYGGHDHGHGHGHGGGSHFHRPRQEVQRRRGGKLVWVRKDGNVGGIKSSAASYA